MENICFSFVFNYGIIKKKRGKKMKDIYQEALEMHEKVKGKLEVQLKVPLNESYDFV